MRQHGHRDIRSPVVLPGQTDPLTAAGQGLALASPYILSAELEAGQLLQLAPVAKSPRHAYFLTHKEAPELRPDAVRLLSYLSCAAR